MDGGHTANEMAVVANGSGLIGTVKVRGSASSCAIDGSFDVGRAGNDIGDRAR